MAAETDGFDVLLTTDKNMRYQQNLAGRKIAVVVLGLQQWPSLQPHLQLVVDARRASGGVRAGIGGIARQCRLISVGRQPCFTQLALLYDYSGLFLERSMRRRIQLKDAKATLSAVVDQAVAGKPAVITRHGHKQAVILSFEDYERLSRVPSFGQLLAAFPG